LNDTSWLLVGSYQRPFENISEGSRPPDEATGKRSEFPNEIRNVPQAVGTPRGKLKLSGGPSATAANRLNVSGNPALSP